MIDKVDVLEWVRRYLQRGWAVYPIVPREKRPAIAGGFHAATHEWSTAREWWDTWPSANVGIATGLPSGIVVVDVDPRNGGLATYRELTRDGTTPTLWQRTGGGGWHLIYKSPGCEVPGCVVGPGIDLKGDGGGIVVAPSVGPSGGVYEWERWQDEIAPLPEWAMHRVMKERVQRLGTHKPRFDVDAIGTIGAGERNITLCRAVGALLRAGKSPEDIETQIAAINAAQCQPPMPSRELERLVRGMVRRYAR